MLYFLSFIAFLSLVVLVGVYFRHAILLRLPPRIRQMFPRLAHYVPLRTFQEQAENGFSSASFDIEANIRDGDSRAGLDERGLEEVRQIMEQERVDFDTARLKRHNRILAANGIDPSGMPTDAKAITRL